MDTNAASLFPARFASRLLADGVFAEAYETVGPERRALLKSLIARLYAVHAGSGCRAAAWAGQESQYRQGVRLRERTEALKWAALVLGPGFSSPVRLLAALMPVLCAGPGETFVMALDGDGSLPAPVVAGLELAGQEHVSLVSAEEAEGVLEDLNRTGRSGAVLALEAEDLPLPDSSLVKLWWPRWSGLIGVWAGEGGFDLEILRWAHPDAVIEVWGGRKPKGDPLARNRRGSFESFLAAGYDAVLVPGRLADLAMRAVPLVLGPGQEAGFAWTGLEPAMLSRKSLALLTADDEGA